MGTVSPTSTIRKYVSTHTKLIRDKGLLAELTVVSTSEMTGYKNVHVQVGNLLQVPHLGDSESKVERTEVQAHEKYAQALFSNDMIKVSTNFNHESRKLTKADTSTLDTTRARSSTFNTQKVEDLIRIRVHGERILPTLLRSSA